MKLKIKVKVITPGCEPVFNDNGDWIDLVAAKDVEIAAPYSCRLRRNDEERTRKVVISRDLVPLGIAMELPKGMEALILPRSSTHKKYNVTQLNSEGVVDYVFKGDDDEWFIPFMAIDKSVIKKGDRVCQFRIQLSQKATVGQKIKWLLSSGVELEFVEELNNPNRGSSGGDK
jgi:dUTP pyrophosphatase